MQTLSIAILHAPDGGYIISQSGGDAQQPVSFAAARTSLPETMQWIADEAAKVFGASPYSPIIQPGFAGPNYPQQQQPQQQPERPRIPEVEEFPNIARREEPDDPTLAGRIGRRMNGVAVIAFMLCLGASKVLGA